MAIELKQRSMPMTAAVRLLNRGYTHATLTARFKDIKVGDMVVVRDLWKDKDLGAFKESLSATVPSHGVVMVKMKD